MERSGTMMSQDVVEGRKGGAMILWCFVDMRGKYRVVAAVCGTIRGGASTF